MGGRSRSYPQPAAGTPTPVAPNGNSQPFGPPDPIPQPDTQGLAPPSFNAPVPNGNTLDGPVLDGPAFPQSSNQGLPALPEFQRPRHTQKPAEDWRSHFAESNLPPVILDGPVAWDQPPIRKLPPPRIGYIELPAP